MSSIETRLTELNLVLPCVPEPIGHYVHAVESHNWLFLSGKGMLNNEGKIGDTLSITQGYALARETGLLLLSVMQQHLGSLDKVAQIVKVFGMVNTLSGFRDHPAVVDGCSDLFIEVFGERGRHARSAMGANSLPANIAVEIEAIVEIQ